MTEKRYYTHKHLIKEDKVHDKICHRFMNITETVEHMNMYYQKYTALKKENEELKQQKQQYKGQRDYLLFVIERTCSKELFEETKSYLKEVE